MLSISRLAYIVSSIALRSECRWEDKFFYSCVFPMADQRWKKQHLSENDKCKISTPRARALQHIRIFFLHFLHRRCNNLILLCLRVKDFCMLILHLYFLHGVKVGKGVKEVKEKNTNVL